ncbi:MAG TPA: triose-phosphate isomerase family protein [Candidatus Bathyarchaeia archaeon]|nr:triose-phosphate isomerase family protein [Candidatus Bathyarchaeia archaeon]
MAKRKLFFIANWKMMLPYSEELSWVGYNYQRLEKLVDDNIRIVLCPSFLSINVLADGCDPIGVMVGAQNCAEMWQGAYTGEVSADALFFAGCQFCIVGHSERRKEFGETDATVAMKAAMVARADVCPIICVGETGQEYDEKATDQVLEKQLMPVMDVMLPMIQARRIRYPSFIIAYEPVWSIGTGIVPDTAYLTAVVEWIKKFVKMHTHYNFYVVYGGSVGEENCEQLIAVKAINGFLIGSASADFQKFEKIVCLTKKSA